MQFGKVFLADYSKDGAATRVAVKLAKLQTTPAEQDEVLAEADIMTTLDHPAVLKVWVRMILTSSMLMLYRWWACACHGSRG